MTVLTMIASTVGGNTEKFEPTTRIEIFETPHYNIAELNIPIDYVIPTLIPTQTPLPTATVEIEQVIVPTPVESKSIPAPAPVQISSQYIQQLICSYDWPCEEALGVVYGNTNCPNGESGGNPLASNGTSFGLFQINFSQHRDKVSTVAELFDVETNVRVAYEIYQDSSWIPWSCHP